MKIGNSEVAMERLDLILHPIRMRVILTAANRVLTPQQLANLLPDVPQTTLYRHINLLLEGGILVVVRESKVRGTLERALTLAQGAGRIDPETAAQLSPEQQEQIFTTFIATLLADFRRVQNQPPKELPPAIYTQKRLSLTVEQLQNLSQEMDALLAAYESQQTPDTQQWLLTGIIMPEALGKDKENES